MSDTDAKDTSKPSTDAKEPVKAETAVTEPQPAPEEPKPLPKEPRKGVYTLEEGDTPGIVSKKFYGRSHKAGELVKANPGCDWQAGAVITLV